MRWITGIFIEIDPIGILRNFIEQMQKEQESLQAQIAKVSGAKQQLKDNISKNEKTIALDIGRAQEGQRMMATSKDPLEVQKIGFKVKENADQAVRLKTTNADLGVLLANLDRIYQLLIRWSTATQYYINDRSNQVDEMAIKRKAVNAAFSAMSSAKKILRGNADDNALYDQTLEYLADDASSKLGEMEDFARVAEDFMLNVDLTTGAASHESLNQLEEMSKKLLPPGSSNPGFIDAIQVSPNQYEPVPVPRAQSAGGFEDFLK
jgi:hypothetical protein